MRSNVNKQIKEISFEAYCNDLNGAEAVELMRSYHDGDKEKHVENDEQRQKYQEVRNS